MGRPGRHLAHGLRLLAGQGLGHTDLTRDFDAVLEPAGARRITLHGLRHNHGSLLIPHGVPVKVVSELLGHLNEAFTVSVYRHALPGMQKAAADRFAAILAGA